MEKEKLERISHLSRKERTIGLDEEEKKEQTGSKEGISGQQSEKAWWAQVGKYLCGR